MPITRELTQEELQKLAASGVDAKQYEGQKVTLYTDDELKGQQPQSSALGAAARGFGAAAPSALGGLGGAALGAELGAAGGPLAPVTVPAGAIIGGIAAGLGVGALQNKVMPDAWQQRLAQDEQEHPWAAKAGELATLPLGGFRPSGEVLQGAAGLGRKLFGGGINETLQAEEREALKNAAIGAGMGAIQSAGTSLATGQDISAGDLAENAAIGAIFNKPWALGRAVGFRDTSALPGRGLPGLPTRSDVETAQEPNAKTPRQPVTAGEMQNAAMNFADVPGTWKTHETKQRYVGKDAEGNPIYENYQVPLKEPVYVPTRNTEDVKADMARALNERDEQQKAADELAARDAAARKEENKRKFEEALRAHRRKQDFAAGKAEIEAQEAQQQQNAAEAADLQAAMQAGQIVGPELRQRTPGTAPATRMEKSMAPTPEELEAERLNELAAKGQARPMVATEGGAPNKVELQVNVPGYDFTQSEGFRRLTEYLKAHKKLDALTPEVFAQLQKGYLNPKGIDATLVEGLKTQGLYEPLTGKVSLMAPSAKGKVARVSSGIHEAAHWFYDRMPAKFREIFERIAKPEMERQVKLRQDHNAKVRAAAEQLPPEARQKFLEDKLVEDFTNEDGTPNFHEFFATEMGWRGMHRILSEQPSLRRSWNDLKTSLRLRGEEPSFEDFMSNAAANLTSGTGKGTYKFGGAITSAQQEGKAMAKSEGKGWGEMTPEEQRAYRRDYMRRQREAGEGYFAQKSPEYQEMLAEQNARLQKAYEKSGGVKGTQPVPEEQRRVLEGRTAGAHPEGRPFEATSDIERKAFRSDEQLIKLGNELKSLQSRAIKTAKVKAQIKELESQITARQEEVRKYQPVREMNQPVPQLVQGEAIIQRKNPETGETENLRNVLKDREGNWIPDQLQVVEKAVRSRYGRIMGGALTSPTKTQTGGLREPGFKTRDVTTAYKPSEEEIQEAISHASAQILKEGVPQTGKNFEENLYNRAATLAHEFFNERAREKVAEGSQTKGVKTVSIETGIGGAGEGEAERTLGETLTKTKSTEKSTSLSKGMMRDEAIEYIDNNPHMSEDIKERMIGYLETLHPDDDVDLMDLAKKFGMAMRKSEGGELSTLQRNLSGATLANNLYKEMVEGRIHQFNISHNKEKVKEGALGEFIKDEGKGYTASINDNDNATHEAVHSFALKNIGTLESLVKHADVSIQDLTRLREFLGLRSYPNHAANLNAMIVKLKAAEFDNNELIKLPSLFDEKWMHAFTKASEEYLAQMTSPTLKHLITGETAEKLFGKDFMQMFNGVFHEEGFDRWGDKVTGPGRAKSIPGDKHYYMSKTEGGLTDLSRMLRTEPALNRAERETGDLGKLVGNAIRSFYPAKQQIFGHYAAKPLSVLEKLSMSDRKYVAQAMYREDIEGVSKRATLLNDKQRDAYDAIRESLDMKQKELIASGRMIRVMLPDGKIVSRPPVFNPTYMPSIPRADVVEALVEKTGDYKKYQKMLLDHWQKEGATLDAAQKKLANFSRIGDVKWNNRARFAAMRLAEGMGLPPELRMQDPAKVLQRYFNRVALDKAWTEQVESKKDVMDALDPRNPNGVSHAFEHIIEQVQGEPYDKENTTIKNLNRLFTSAFLGPLTNIHIVGSTLFNPMQYMKASELFTAYPKAMADLSAARQRAIANGYKTKDFSSVYDIVDSGQSFNQKLASLSSIVGKVNGREWSDTASKVMAQALADQIIPMRLSDANAGDTYSANLLRHLDPNWTAGKKYSVDEQSQLASTLAGFIHGAHDARTLPEWMTKESVLKPFFSLMSWSVAQTNQWNKHVWQPALKGNLQPLLLSTLGAAVGGYAIQQLREAINNKQSNIPSLTEIASSSKGLEGNMPLLAYNFMQMASYTGFAGIGSQLTKDVFDLAYKNKPQGSAFPLDEAMTEGVKNVTQGVGAWMQNPTWENFFDIMPRLMSNLVKENYQTGRIAMNWAGEYGMAGETEEYKHKVSKEEGGLRRYRMAEGLPYNEQVGMESNPYLNLQARQFKQTENLQEAMKDVPGLMQLAMQRAQGNPDILRQQFQSLKQNSYQTMPSPENMPIQFAKYYQYLVATRGQAAANQVLQDYMRHNAINRVKSSMIPSL